MLPSISLLQFIFILVATELIKCFRINTQLVKFHQGKQLIDFDYKLKPHVYHDSELGSLILGRDEFKTIPNYLRYENLTNFITDKAELVQNLKRNLSRYRNLTVKTVEKFKRSSLANFRKCYSDLWEEIKFWYLKGSNFSFYDLFTLGSNPVYLLVKLNLALFIVDLFFKGELSKNFSVKGLNLFYMNEHYRIATSLFFHWDLRHLLSNVGSLLSVGNNVLKLFGPRNLLIIYFVSGITANYFSYLYNYIYKNGIPANLLLLLRSIGKNFSNATKPIIMATNTIVDDILNKTRRIGFPMFFFDYIFTSATMSADFCLAKLAQFVTGITPRSLNDVDLKVKEICMTKSKNDFKSCGASSSIFGLYGALLTYYIKSGYINNYSVINNLFVSFVVPYLLRSFTEKLDHISHLVGFITGSILSTVLD
ncbi:putative rhomboid family protein [Theileria annulata]|uniref:Possible rhomboid family protein n=1 Tax=Theileria annulata TaxID=5874 RepID=Q4UB35_THEAN|nr:putative rhomboid family protein [Theileria annulata]CAI75966.1 Possible rhomboid family protein [Theileria annulata]|eukprot:XP_955442.1 Possible rhomboid family protein [Theileria annulata]